MAKGLGVDTRVENALLVGAGSKSWLGVVPNGERVGAPKAEEVCEGMGSGTVDGGNPPCPVCSTNGCKSSSASTSINSSNSS